MSDKKVAKNVVPQPVVQVKVNLIVLALLFNAAHPILDPKDREKYSRNRENEPWVVIFPDLGVVSTITNRDGDPLTGKINIDYGSLHAENLYRKLVADPELLASYRAKNDMPKIEDGYKGKLIPVSFKI